MTANQLPLDLQHRYATPEALVNDRSLPKAEKRALLSQWQRDLQQLQVATEENMPHLGRATPAPHADEGRTADLLQRVSNCLLLIEPH